MRTTILTMVLVFAGLTNTWAQDEGGGKGRRRPPRNPPPAEANQAALQNQRVGGNANGLAGVQNAAGQNAAGQNNNGTPPFDAAAWSTAMLQQFDTDGDAKLDQSELSQCLSALAQMVQAQNQAQQRQGGGQMGMGGGGRGFGGPPGPPPEAAGDADKEDVFGLPMRARGGGGGGPGGGGQGRSGMRRGG